MDKETSTCLRCSVLEDLLETATSERDKARDEASKADRETMSLKHREMDIRYKEAGKYLGLIKYFRMLALELGASPSQMLERD